MNQWLVLMAAVGTLSLLTASCGDAVGYPKALTGDQTVGGVVFIDRNQNGQPDSNDEAVAQARIEPLRGFDSEGLGRITYGLDPNASDTTSQADGTFFLSHGVEPTTAGIALHIMAPADETASVRGELTRTIAVQTGTTENAIAIPSLPRDCVDAADCDELRPPDLHPITSWSQIAPDARAKLQAVAAEPPNRGLLPTETWHLETTPDGRRLLRFSSVTANIGTGPLHIIADRNVNEEEGLTPTWQRIWTRDWNYLDEPSGTFVFHPGHEHMHFDAFERYRLFDENDNLVAESAKVSFCLRDSVRVSDEPPSTIGPFGSDDECGDSEQSINVGFADHYDELLPDQWIDVTGVAPGPYTVEITVDPANLIHETNETNNHARFAVEISADKAP